uniref:RNA-directed RNA polymerase n=1 Tax=Upmeje virus TaxID=2739778 RepID=A0A859D189_9TOMB|nr:RNA-dependent RNA polymerase [Upmeje virus]
MPAVCLGKYTKTAIAGRVVIGPTTPGRQHTRHVTRFFPLPPLDGLWQVSTHHNCRTNELVSLYQRHLTEYPVKVEVAALQRCRRQLLRLASQAPLIYPLSVEQAADHYRGLKRKKMRLAAQSLEERPIEENDARVKMFIKQDKYPADAVLEKAPRAIQYRSPRYTIQLACYLTPLERWVYTREWCAKGANSWERAARYIRAMQRFDNPVAIEVDYSKFDAHISMDLLRLEHGFYNAVYGHDETLHTLLRWQLRNRGTTPSGLRYQTRGKRMSGDLNTGLGNTVINYAILSDITRDCRSWMLIDGDDSILLIERDDLRVLADRLGALAATHGQTAKWAAVDPWEVEFCQSKLMPIGLRWRFVRNPRRAISHDSVTTTKYPPHILSRLRYAIGQCELACMNGVPVLQEMALAMMRLGDPTPIKATEDIFYRAKHEGRAMRLEITQEARYWFERQFGITLAQQYQLEHYYAALDDPETVTYVDQDNQGTPAAEETCTARWSRRGGFEPTPADGDR